MAKNNSATHGPNGLRLESSESYDEPPTNLKSNEVLNNLLGAQPVHLYRLAIKLGSHPFPSTVSGWTNPRIILQMPNPVAVIDIIWRKGGKLRCHLVIIEAFSVNTKI